MTKYHFTLLPINQMWYGKTKCVFEFSTTKLIKPTHFGFYRRKKRCFCMLVNHPMIHFMYASVLQTIWSMKRFSDWNTGVLISP